MEARAGGAVHPQLDRSLALPERSGTGLNWRSQAPSPADVSVAHLPATHRRSLVRGIYLRPCPLLSTLPFFVMPHFAHLSTLADIIALDGLAVRLFQTCPVLVSISLVGLPMNRVGASSPRPSSPQVCGGEGEEARTANDGGMENGVRRLARLDREGGDEGASWWGVRWGAALMAG